MKKLLTLVVAGAALLAACGSGGGVAATVNGTDITVSDVDALIDSGGATIPTEQFAQYLTAAIQFDIFFDAAEADFGVSATDEEIEAEAQRLFEELATSGETREDFLSSRGVTEEFLAKIAEQSVVDVAMRDILGEEIGEPTQEEIDAATGALTTACVSHILVDTEDEANAAMARLDEGEDFGAIASEISTDTGSAANNGELPCGSPSGYVEPFRLAVLDATVGEVYPVAVESQYGYHIILVTELTEPTDDELAESVREAAIAAEVQEWFNGVMESAEVTVNEEFGTWQALPPSVIPPTDGTTSTTTG